MRKDNVSKVTLVTEFFGHLYMQVLSRLVKNCWNCSICPRIFWTPLVQCYHWT